MPSELFTFVFDDPEADQARSFSRHLSDLLDLRDEDVSKCVDALPAFERAVTPRQENEIVDRLKEECSADRYQLAHSISVLSFFVNGLTSDEIPNDDFAAWPDDLLGRGWISETTSDKFNSIIRRWRESLPALRTQTEERRTAAGVLPALKVASYTVEIRPIRRERYRWGNSIDKYQPQIVGTVPVASIHIGLDVKLARGIDFQADEVGLQYMIDTLQAAIKDIAAFRAYLRLGGDDEGGLNG